MLNVERLLASELWAVATGEQLKAAFALWCRAWKQVPAASLPNDMKIIAAFSGMGREPMFNRHKHVVMRGFVLCSDNRWYHRTLAEDANRAWLMKRRRATERNAEAERVKRWRERRSNGYETPYETPYVTRTKGVRQGQVQGQREYPPPIVPPPPGRARATRLPEDWQPSESERAYAIQHGVKPELAAEEFRNYWHARSGKDATKLDWSAVFRNRVLALEEDGKFMLRSPVGAGDNWNKF